jgi:hypothetical protein
MAGLTGPDEQAAATALLIVLHAAPAKVVILDRVMDDLPW